MEFGLSGAIQLSSRLLAGRRPAREPARELKEKPDLRLVADTFELFSTSAAEMADPGAARAETNTTEKHT